MQALVLRLNTCRVPASDLPFLVPTVPKAVEAGVAEGTARPAPVHWFATRHWGLPRDPRATDEAASVRRGRAGKEEGREPPFRPTPEGRGT
eukprot:12835646-Alexandrium_andersonii.AAC.1